MIPVLPLPPFSDTQTDHICLTAEGMDMRLMNQVGIEGYLGKTPLKTAVGKRSCYS